MPNRIIKESIRTDKSINELNDFQFRLWLYLITYVDDYGCGSAEPDILKGFVFPRRKAVTEKSIADGLAALEHRGLINLYKVGGELYFCFPNWGKHQRVRNQQRKFPEPSSGAQDTYSDDFAADCGESRRVAADCGELPPESESNPNPNMNTNPNPKKKEKRGTFACSSKKERNADRFRALLEADVLDENLTPFAENAELASAVTDWFNYKSDAKGRAKLEYADISLRKLLSEIAGKYRENGLKYVRSAIDKTISRGYQGITWDLAEKTVQRGRGQSVFDEWDNA